MDNNFNQKTSEFTKNITNSDTGSPILGEKGSVEQESPANSPINGDFPLTNGENAPKTAENAESYQGSTEQIVEIKEKTERNTCSASISPTTDGFFNTESENDLLRAFPSVNVLELKNSANFQSLLALIKSNPSLCTVYSCYNAIIASAEENSRQKLAQALANAKASVGPLASREESDSIFFTKEQVLKMSPEQIRKNFTKIRQSQEKW